MHPRLRNSSSIGAGYASRIVMWIGVTIALAGTFFIFALLNPTHHGAKPVKPTPAVIAAALNSTNVKCSQIVDSDSIPDNSQFVVSRESKTYTLHKDLKCWKSGCSNARQNKHAFASCENPLATEWNTLGALAMEHVIQGELKEPHFYNSNFLKDAKRDFEAALKLSPDYFTARLNLALILAFNRSNEEAKKHFDKIVISSNVDNEKLALAHVFAGLNEELKAQRMTQEAVDHYDKVRSLAPELEKEWWGVVTTMSGRAELYHAGVSQEADALIDMVAWKWFGPRAIGRWALLDPGTPDDFSENRFIVLRRILPPFVLRGAARCYRRLISEGQLRLGDTQSKRYTAYNDRCARFLHYELTDLVRRVIAHNARPSYTYFGGYVAGAELKPHNDRLQCEWTMSLQIEQTPHDKIWMLSLGKKPKGEYSHDDDHFPEEEIADADLSEGDALLFMGRQLVHFRRGLLPEGQTTNQVFLHYVPEDFTGSLN